MIVAFTCCCLLPLSVLTLSIYICTTWTNELLVFITGLPELAGEMCGSIAGAGVTFCFFSLEFCVGLTTGLEGGISF